MKNAYVDTNVLVRFLTGDPPDLASKARTLFKDVEDGKLILIIPEIVIAETVWVLLSFYHFPPQKIARVMQEFVGHQGMEIDNRTNLLFALNIFAEKNIDFADAIAAVHMTNQGTEEIYSFDKHFDRIPGITRLSPGEKTKPTSI